jgi:hypothetical protein
LSASRCTTYDYDLIGAVREYFSRRFFPRPTTTILRRVQYLAAFGCALASLGARTPAARAGAGDEFDAWNDAFAGWIRSNQIDRGGWAKYYRFGRFPDLPSTIATAFAILYFVQEDPKVAAGLAHALITEQQRFARDKVVGGGIPSDPNRKNPSFYSGDALLVLDAMNQLYVATHDDAFLAAGAKLAGFVARLADGKRLGALSENVSFPIAYVQPDGTFENTLRTDVTLLCFKALADYAALAHDHDIAQLYENGRRFILAEAQDENGCFYDRYDPGYPPRRYERARWRYYASQESKNVVLADNVLMAALGAQRLGGTAQVERFLGWLKPRDGRFYGYTDARTSASAFLSRDVPYFDVVVSGMYAALLYGRTQAPGDAVAPARRFLSEERAPDGGWYWGRFVDGSHVDANAEALTTGFWAIRALQGRRWLS